MRCVGGEHDPWFVARKDIVSNTLYVVQGTSILTQSPASHGSRPSFCSGRSPEAGRLSAKTRYRQEDAACDLAMLGADELPLHLPRRRNGR